MAAENLYWAICHKLLRMARELDEMPEELEQLERQLADTYFCNFTSSSRCRTAGPSTSSSR